MAIIVSKTGVAAAALVGKSCFQNEANLQEYIHQHPEAIPIYDIREDKRLFVELASSLPDLALSMR